MARYFFLAFLFVTSVPGNAQPDLNVWNELLVEAVSEGVVDYAQWRKNPQFYRLAAQIAKVCVRCGRSVKVVACIGDQNVIARILAHLREKEQGRPTLSHLTPPFRAPPRPLPLFAGRESTAPNQ